MITTNDEDFNKAHVMYLESKIYKELKDAGTIRLKNNQTLSGSSLSESDLIVMEEFKENVYLVLGVLGYSGINVKVSSKLETKTDTWQPQSMEDYVFVLRKNNKIIAQMKPTPQGYQLVAGAIIQRATQSFQKDNYAKASKRRRSELYEKGYVKEVDGKVKLIEDVIYNSPSAVTEVVLGKTANGRTEWKTEEGKTFAEIEDVFLGD